MISSSPLEYSAACLHAVSLPIIAIGGHVRKQNQPHGLPFLDSVLNIPAVFLMAGAALAWLWLVAPFQYFMTLVCGAPARAAQSSTYMLYARMENGILATDEETKLGANAPAGYWDASMRDTPLVLVSYLSAGLLFVIRVVSS